MRIGRLYRRAVVLAGFLVVALVLVLDGVGALRGLDQASIDWRFSIRGSQGPSPHVVVVGIDASTFSHIHAHYPFPRRFDAKVIDNLVHDGARVIAYDIQFTEATDVADDNALITAVRNARNVVLATTEVARGGRTRIFGGGAGLTYSRATPAESQFPVDADGEIRRMNAQVLGLTTFSMAAAERFEHRLLPFPGGRTGTAVIDFRGPAGTFHPISYWQVLDRRFAPGTFRGKIVVVGATEPTLHDIHATATSDLMSGPEVQANAIGTVLRGFPLALDAGGINVVLIIIAGLAAPLLALVISAELAAGLALAAMALYAVVCQLLFDGGTVTNFVAPAIAGIAASIVTLLLSGTRAVFEREQTRSAFARFVPESVVSEVLASADGIRLGGVERHATILFSDLRGFTTFSESRSPDETLSVLNRYLTEMTEAILDHGGTLVSYMGDGIMAVFGAPLVSPDHADRAVAAARDMLARLETFNATLKQEGAGEGFKMGIGLNSGEVISGNVGSLRRLEYTTIGDATNTASRIEGLTKGTPHQLFVADTTYEDLLVKPLDLAVVGEFPIRGRSAAVTLWGLAELIEPSAAQQPDPSVAPPAKTPDSPAGREHGTPAANG